MKHKSYLIQRLNPPVGGYRPELVEAFSFGGGYRNGGLSADAMKLLRPIFSFDYMGAAEFEFGAVPEALSRIYDDAVKGRLAAGQFTVEHNGATHDLYYLCRNSDIAEVQDRVRSWLLPYAERPHMKEAPRLDRVLEGDEWASTRGWLELDNGFFVFADADMWRATCELFATSAVTV